MNFCNNCGADLKQHKDARFCHNCGNPLEADDHLSLPQSSNFGSSSGIRPSGQTRATGKSTFGNGYNSYGIIFTNLNALANRLNCGVEEVESVILNYISQVDECGHQYVLLDAGNNSYSNIDADDGWQSYVELLKDFHNDNSQAEYLFIIGGHDVVPIPIFDNKLDGQKKDWAPDIDSDMPYVFLETEKFSSKLFGGTLFNQSEFYYVSRLPLSSKDSDMNIDFIDNILENSIKTLKHGLCIQDNTNISALEWVGPSSAVVKSLDINKALIESPDVFLDSINSEFNFNASLVYINLHGGKAPNRPSYSNDGDVFDVEQIESLQNHNMVVAECCWGARFSSHYEMLNFDTHQSMLLSGFKNKTVVFLGSSRIAFGCVGDYSDSNMSGADLISKYFMEYFLSGENAGRAFSMAKAKMYDNSDYSGFVFTALEFNLFGDPLIANSPFHNDKTIKHKSINARKIGLKSLPKYELIQGFNPTSKSDDIYERIMNRMDFSLNKIFTSIDKNLMDKLGLSELNFTKAYKISDGMKDEIYSFEFKKEKGDNELFISFATNKAGKILNVISTK